MSSQSANDAAQVLSGIMAIVEEEARRGTYHLGERVIGRLILDWGGQRIYIGKDQIGRDRLAYALFNGRNYNQIARIFGVSEPAARRMIARERARLNEPMDVTPVVSARNHNRQLTFFNFDKVRTA
jgi:Mor family transcriptional regulator